MAFRTKKISQMDPKGSNLAPTDLLEISELVSGSYVTKSITGQEIIDSVPPATVEWGSIGGDITAQNDLQLALDSKFDVPNGNTTQYLDGAGTPTTLNKSAVGLGNVDNTSDLNKPISTATQTALNAKENTITAGTTSQYYRGDKTFQTLDKTAVGLSNVDNTSDANKPISTATQTALNAKVNSNTTITGATKTKITYDSKGLVTAGADATTADIADSLNKRYVTDANLTTLANTSGTNTGDQTLSGLGGVPTTRTISTTAPLSGGGDLSADRTLSIATANGTTTGALSSTDWNTFNNKQSALTLTTTGTSGAATLVGSTLNIPQYSGGGGSATWGGITGTLSSQTDLQTALNAKQATLASGSNIKTINGNSVLGSGDININTGAHGWRKPASGQYIHTGVAGNGGTTSTAVGTAGKVWAYPFISAQDLMYTAININVSVGVVGALARIVIYNDSNGVPGTKIFESTDIDCSTTGVKSVALADTLLKGKTYWIGVHSSSTATFTAMPATNLLPLNYNGTSIINTHCITTYTYGSLPSTFGSPGYVGLACPYVFFTAS